MTTNTTTKSQNRDRSRLARIALPLGAALILAAVLAGCSSGGGGGGVFGQKEILSRGETPAGLAECSFKPGTLEGNGDDSFDAADDEYNGPHPVEFGMQFFAPSENPYCEDAPFVIQLTYQRYASDDFQEVAAEAEEARQYHDCSGTVVFMWGDNRAITGAVWHPSFFTESSFVEPTGYEEDYANVHDALQAKYPGWESIC